MDQDSGLQLIEPSSVSDSTWATVHWVATGCCLVSFVAAGLVAVLVLEQVPHLEDEVAYLFQAQVFSMGRLYVQSPDQPGCFFAPFVLDFEGRRFGKYPPGWPAILSVGVSLRQPWLVNAAGAALTVALVFRLAKSLYGGRTAGLAAGLTMISPFVLLLAGSLMSHTWCLAFLTAFLWAFYQCWEGDCAHQDRWAWVSGLSLGAAFAIRPFTAVAFAIPSGFCVLWRLVWHREHRPLWFLLLGFCSLAVSVFACQAIWTGDPLQSPYTLFWPYDRLGFGPGTGPLPGGNTLWLGLSGSVAAIGHLASDLFGWPALSLAFVVLLFMFRPRRRWDLFMVLSALALILGYALYWTSGDVFGPRYAYEGVSALIVLSARGIVQVGGWLEERGRLWTLKAGLGVLVAVGLMLYWPWQISRYRGLYGITAKSRAVLTECGLEHALVIVEEERGWWDYAVAFSMNAPTLDGEVVYASDCGPEVEALLQTYSDRAVYRFDGEHLLPYDGTGAR